MYNINYTAVSGYHNHNGQLVQYTRAGHFTTDVELTPSQAHKLALESAKKQDKMIKLVTDVKISTRATTLVKSMGINVFEM